jgi:hypothetical protein
LVGVLDYLGAGLKKWVVRPMSNSLSKRIDGDLFLKVLDCSYNTLILSV